MTVYQFAFNTKNQRTTVYVTGSNFRTAYAKFTKAYPKANILEAWKSSRSDLPRVLK